MTPDEAAAARHLLDRLLTRAGDACESFLPAPEGGPLCETCHATTDAHLARDAADALSSLQAQDELAAMFVWEPAQQAYRIGQTDRLIATVAFGIVQAEPDPDSPLKWEIGLNKADQPLTEHERLAIYAWVSNRLRAWVDKYRLVSKPRIIVPGTPIPPNIRGRMH